MPAFIWMVDITDERHPVPVGSFQVEGIEGKPQPTMTACHQPCEKVTGTEIPFAWFAQGLRIIDVEGPARAPRGRALHARRAARAPTGCRATT